MTDFLNGLLEVVKSVIDGMPVLSLEGGTLSSISTALSTIVSWVKVVNFMVPLDTILLVVSIVLAIRMTKFSIFIANWIIRRIADFFP